MTENEFRLPDLGEGLTEADLLSWSVSVGDTVALNQVLAEVETSKAAVELPSPFAGTVRALLAAPGDTVPVGAPLIRIETIGHDPATTTDAAAAQRDSVLVGYGPSAPAPSRRRARRAPTPRFPNVTSAHVTTPDVTLGNQAPGTQTRVPIRGIRKRTAAAMVRSAFTAPHVTVFATCDVTATVQLLDRLRVLPQFAGLTPTPLPLVARAMLVSLRTHPDLNSSWDEERQEIVVDSRVHLGIATDTERGLLVPTVRDAQAMSLVELTRAIDDRVAVARAGTATPADLTGGTITITNVGVFGVDAGTPILTPGEAANLCLGAIARRPWVVDDEVVPRWVTTLGLSIDHRVVDGAQGSRFLADVAALLTDPLTLLARA
ncbi:dihydrolipoamide acetyltransferase family protein [Rhodococcus sp. NPDC058505]|uniref:dihydrolipoamide acetyltransferase family protein n=1 Tax=unclassified Rhodococcus (in: high G+C Gram-positive bacteria) TaxID=192944 RepID=UPI0036551DEC